ncbi:IucA/IucC family protein [Methylophaga thiooxydans]|uniref:IucA/IucC family protein n=1 Tax=Methylophaga thiooxydans TaxID=392484 RepID=UPI002356E450|nr:IucA/IucC family protein [Methylophaga thiooxydans]
MNQATHIAEIASYQAFLNCFLNEFDNGHWHAAKQWQHDHRLQGLMHGEWLVELKLTSQRCAVVIDVSFYSLTGHHHFLQVWQQNDDSSWRPIPMFSLLVMLVREIYHRTNESSKVSNASQEIELLARLVSSYQLMSLFLDLRWQDAFLSSSRFIDTEQSLLYGHWSHPTPKSRQGMHEWQQPLYSPELQGNFQLVWYAASETLIEQDSVTSQTALQMMHDIIGDSGEEFMLKADEVALPLHPLQADKLEHDNHIQSAILQGKLRKIGPAGPVFTPTSSVRTLYQPKLPWMLKVSLPVKITNSQRLNQKHELKAGVVAAKLLANSQFCTQFPGFHIITDPAYITLNLAGLEESGFETVIRSNPFPEGQDEGIYSVAALMQDPVFSSVSALRRLIEGLALSEGRNSKVVCRDWFSLYWQNAIEPLIRLFDLHGIALEAHQQNSVLDVSSGYPRRYFYRDNQGFYLAESYRQHILDLEPMAQETEELFYDETMIQDRFGYYLILNQLAGVIHRFAADGLIAETVLLEESRQRLRSLQQQLDGAGARLIHRFLNAEFLPCKSNLLTRVHDVDELTAEMEQAVYTQVRNPFLAQYPVIEEETDANSTRFAQV